jgi:oligoribonuclease NrnB/cAMP/cGMP phosphodiesterase (DHH superfamily)
MSSFNIDTIVYHSPCSDGVTSAWAIWRYFKDAKLIPISHGQKLSPDDYTNKTVAVVDFCFSKDYILSIADTCKKLIILDHHKSAERDLVGLSHKNVELIFDMNRSGAQIAWDYMESKRQSPRPYHWFVESVADQDLWRWSLPWSRVVNKATYELGFHESVHTVDALVSSGKSHDDFTQVGKLLMEKMNIDVEKYAREAFICKMLTPVGTFTVALSSPPDKYVSEVGAKIANTAPVDFAVMYSYDFGKDTYKLSFRASPGKVDLSYIAKTLPNGGGHASSAGAVIYGPRSSPPVEFANKKGETMNTYFI